MGSNGWLRKKYCCASAIYLLSCLVLEFSVTIDKSVEAPRNEKDMVDGVNAIYGRRLKLATAKLLNPELIQDEPIFQVHAG